jgi:Fe-S cluster assembly protein SufB
MSSDQDPLKETDTEARFEFKKDEKSAFETEKDLTEGTVRVISEDKDEPEWMLERRLRALKQLDRFYLNRRRLQPNAGQRC